MRAVFYLLFLFIVYKLLYLSYYIICVFYNLLVRKPNDTISHPVQKISSDIVKFHLFISIMVFTIHFYNKFFR